MLTSEQIQTIARNFTKEACDFLGMDADLIRIICVPEITEKSLSSPNVILLDKEDTIVVSDSFLSNCIHTKSLTPLRAEMYEKTRLIYKKLKAPIGFNQHSPHSILDAKQYASALNTLKGLCLSCPQQFDPKEIFSGVENIIKKEFGLNGNFLKMPIEPYNGCDFYKMHLNREDTEKICMPFLKPSKSIVNSLSIGEEGTIDHPFNNIYDAISYLEKIEKEAYAKDRLMTTIAQQKYFYDGSLFRITWASAQVAHFKNDYPSHSFLMSQMAPLDLRHPEVSFFSLKPNLYKRKFLYRGQNDYYPGKACVPNLFRDKDHNEQQYYLDFLIFSQELELLIRSHPLTQLLEAGIEILHDSFKIRMHYTGLAQHYYNKSSFLDLTSDIEVMKFFATTSYDSKTDRYYPFKDTAKTGVIYYYELLFPGAFQPHKGYALKTIGKQVFMRSGAQSGFLLDMDKGYDFKKLPEVKAIYFKHDPEISEKIFMESNEGDKYFADDTLQYAWHNRMKRRFESRIVSKKTVEYNVTLNSGETVESITQKLKDRGITVDDFIPQFTEEELDIYYKSIQNGWWEDFCSDIYFHGADGELYRDELKNIRNRPEYKRAFTR